MSWDVLPFDLKNLIYEQRFIIMSGKKLEDILYTDEDLPFNPNVDVSLVRQIHKQFHNYQYFCKDKYLKQVYRFLDFWEQQEQLKRYRELILEIYKNEFSFLE